jgi:hypothetical protein
MAAPSNTFLTSAAVGNREDLSDMIYRIDPTDTPFVSGIEREKASAITHEWQTQSLAAAAANKQAEGDTPSANSTTATVRLGNVCQIMYKVASVSGSQEAVEHAGRDSEIAYQEMLKGLELKRDLEYNLLQSNQAKSTSSPRAFADILSWIKSNTSKESGGSDPSAADGTGTRTDASTPVVFKETDLKTVLSSCWTNGGKPNLIMTGAFNKQQFSTFTGRATTTQDAKSKRIVASVDFYESDFGKLSVAPNRFQRARDVFVLQMDMWALAPLNGRDMISLPLAKLGDSTQREILWEGTLVARNEKSSGGVFDKTSS